MKVNNKELEMLIEAIKDTDEINIFEGKMPGSEIQDLLLVFDINQEDNQTGFKLTIEDSDALPSNEEGGIIK